MVPLPRVGNFIIGASGSDKQMLCASSGARAALNIAARSYAIWVISSSCKFPSIDTFKIVPLFICPPFPLVCCQFLFFGK